MEFSTLLSVSNTLRGQTILLPGHQVTVSQVTSSGPLYHHPPPAPLHPQNLILLERFSTESTFVSSYLLFPRFNDLLLRCRELDTWTQDLALPAVVWLSGFFNPQAFLTGKSWGRAAPDADGAMPRAEPQPHVPGAAPLPW